MAGGAIGPADHRDPPHAGRAGTISRLRELGLEDRAIASALRGVVAQRLLRKLCDHCAMGVEAGSLPPSCRPPADVSVIVAVRTPVGCPDCGYTGYRGRFAIQETLTIDASIAASLASGAPVDVLVRAGERGGMRTLWQAGLRRVWAGETSHEELARVVGPARADELLRFHDADGDGRLAMPEAHFLLQAPAPR